MGTFNLEELALRSAVNSAPKTISQDSDTYNTIKKTAESKIKTLVGGSNVAGLVSELDPKTMAIGAAVEVLKLGYIALKDQIANLKDKRLSFDKERQAGIATFLIPTNKEESNLSKQERVIKRFMELVEKNSAFKTYFGIHISNLTEMPNTIFYSVLPFYQMSEQLPQPTASDRLIDKIKISINLFFKSALPDSIADIDNEFRNENRFAEFWKAAYKKDNYLNDLRSQRFIIICLANLLWNLQHPVDPDTGFRLNLKESIQLCKDVGLFLNLLLNSSRETYLKQISTSHNQLLVSFARRVETHIKSLCAGFIQQQLYDLNMRDLNNSAHESLRIMDQSIFKLLYYKKNPITQKKEPDGNAAGSLIDTIGHLTQLLTYNPQLIEAFIPFADHFEKPPFLNTPAFTIIDALIIFIQSTNEHRLQLFQELEKNKTDNAHEFINSLHFFNAKFIKPIKKVSKIELEASFFNKKSKEVATLTTKRLMPFITLALDDYRISVDTPQSSLIVVQNKKNNIPEKKYLAKEQIIEINKQAHQGGEFYNWELSPFIELSKGTEDELDKLPKYQHRFTEITKLLDSVSEIVENYRSFLQLKSFQQFLIKCLNKIKDEYHNLGRHIDNIDTLLSQDQLINRNMTSILGPMSQDLMKGLSSFSAAFSDFEHIICDPNFTEQQKQLLTTKIKGIDQQFTALFNEDSGVIHSITQSSIDDINSLPIKIIPRTCPALIEAAIPKANPALLVDEQKLDTSRPIKTPQKNSDKLAPINNEPQLTLDFKTANNPIQTANLMIDMEDKISSPTNKKPSYRAIHEEMYVDVKHVVALRQLIERCYEALSYQSKHSEKGYLLNNLLHLIENKPHFSESNMTQAMNELARITLSYRRTFFFQAAYGETRSGKIFISAIKYPKLNQILPVASLMFGSEIDVSQESDEYIIKRCQNIKESNHWPETASQIHPIIGL